MYQPYKSISKGIASNWYSSLLHSIEYIGNDKQLFGVTFIWNEWQ